MTRRPRFGAAALIAAMLLAAGCAPPRRTQSNFERLLGTLPLSSAMRFLVYDDIVQGARGNLSPGVEQSLTDGVWSAFNLSGSVPAPASGDQRGDFSLDRASGRITRDRFVLVGPSDQIESALAWLQDPRLSAAADPALIELSRAVGEPAHLEAGPAPAACPPRVLAAASRSQKEGETTVNAWVLLYAGPDGGARAAADDLSRVQAAVKQHPPGEVLQVDLRPRYIVVTHRGMSRSPAESICR